MTKQKYAGKKRIIYLFFFFLILFSVMIAYVFMINIDKNQKTLIITTGDQETERLVFLANCQKIEAFYQQHHYYPPAESINQLIKNTDMAYHLIDKDHFELRLNSNQNSLVYYSDSNESKEVTENRSVGEPR